MILAIQLGGRMRFAVLSGFLLFCFCTLGNSPCRNSIRNLYSRVAVPFEVLGNIGKMSSFQKVLDGYKLRALNRDLKRIRNMREEDQLREQGFQSSYYLGVGKARELVRVGEYIRGINADPHTTHISYFANQIYAHIREVERGIRTQTEELVERLKILEDFRRETQSDNQALGWRTMVINGGISIQTENLAEERLRILEDFKKEAQSRIDNQTVTYDWWVIFNMRLSALATLPSALREMFEDVPRKHKLSSEIQQIDFESIDYLKTYEGMKTALKKRFKYAKSFESNNVQSFNEMMKGFPKEILFFGVNDMGFMAWNRMVKGTYFIQLSGDVELFADGRNFNSFAYALHDINHAELSFREDSVINQVENRIKSISDVKKREQAELAWFILRHEEGFFDFFHTEERIEELEVSKNSSRIYRTGARQMMMERRDNFIDPKDFRMALPVDVSPHNPQQVEQFILESADILSDIVPIIDDL